MNTVFEIFQRIFVEASVPSEHLKYKENTVNDSIYYFSNLLCNIKLTGKEHYISFRSDYRKLFDGFETKQISSDPSKVRVIINRPEDILRIKDQIIAIVKAFAVPCTFDVCSRYMQCSDAKHCVHPDQVHAKECSYKRKLENGTIFYGKNRNV